MPKLTSVFAATLLIPRLRPPWGLTTSLRQVYVGSSCDCPAPRFSHSEQLASIRPSGLQGRGIIYVYTCDMFIRRPRPYRAPRGAIEAGACHTRVNIIGR